MSKTSLIREKVAEAGLRGAGLRVYRADAFVVAGTGSAAPHVDCSGQLASQHVATHDPTPPRRPARGAFEGGEKRSVGVGARQRASSTDSPPLFERSEPQVSVASSAARPWREHRSGVGPQGRPADRPRGRVCVAAWRAQTTSRPQTAQHAHPKRMLRKRRARSRGWEARQEPHHPTRTRRRSPRPQPPRWTAPSPPAFDDDRSARPGWWCTRASGTAGRSSSTRSPPPGAASRCRLPS